MTDSDDQGVAGRRAQRLGTLLARTDAAPRAMTLPAGLALRPRPLVARWQLAAALLLLIAGAAGVPPLRAWIAATVHSVWRRIAGSQPPASLTPNASSRGPALESGAVSFPLTDPLTIRVAARQAAGGSLRFVTVEGSLVTASIVGPADAAELLIGPEGLRILNRRASAAGYVIGVPASVTRALVQIGQEPVRTISMPADSARNSVNLGVRSGPAGPLKE